MLELSTLGWVHTFFALLSVLSGTIVVLIRKGHPPHRAWGYLYFFSMLATNGTAFLIYDLTGRFNFFHASALFSLLTLVIGMIPVFIRRPRKNRGWLTLHAHFMSGSYIGVIAATVAEVTSRVPGWNLALATGLSTLAVSVIGITIIRTRTPGAIAGMNSRRAAGRLSGD